MTKGALDRGPLFVAIPYDAAAGSCAASGIVISSSSTEKTLSTSRHQLVLAGTLHHFYRQVSRSYFFSGVCYPGHGVDQHVEVILDFVEISLLYSLLRLPVAGPLRVLKPTSSPHLPLQHPKTMKSTTLSAVLHVALMTGLCVRVLLSRLRGFAWEKFSKQ